MTRVALVTRVLAAVAVLAVSGCTSATRPREPASHKETVLQTGSVSGSPWKLTVFSSPEGEMCMGINADLPVQDTQKDTTFAEDGCGFGPDGDGQSSAIDSASASGKGDLYYGPAPVGAVVARLDGAAITAEAPGDPSATHIPGCALPHPAHVWVRITHRLPTWTKRGRWFIVHIADPNGCGYFDATFFNRSGHRVTEPHW